jgi:hypothetical protein
MQGAAGGSSSLSGHYLFYVRPLAAQQFWVVESSVSPQSSPLLDEPRGSDRQQRRFLDERQACTTSRARSQVAGSRFRWPQITKSGLDPAYQSTRRKKANLPPAALRSYTTDSGIGSSIG